MADNVLRYGMDYGAPDNPLTAGAPTWADAAQWHAQNLQATLAAIRDPKTWVDAANQYGNALLMGTTTPGIRAFHGSPYDFERFDAAKIGTGEGSQWQGRGLYFADREGTAQTYRDVLSSSPAETLLRRYAGDVDEALYHARRAANTAEGRMYPELVPQLEAYKAGTAPLPAPSGKMYEVNIRADPEHMLDWDKPLSEQSQHVKDALGKIPWAADYLKTSLTGGQIAPSSVEGMQQLRDAGIPGIRYLDQGSRSTGTGTRNYVIFDPGTIEILRKYGIGGLIAGGGAAAGAAGNGGQDQ